MNFTEHKIACYQHILFDCIDFTKNQPVYCLRKQ